MLIKWQCGDNTYSFSIKYYCFKKIEGQSLNDFFFRVTDNMQGSPDLMPIPELHLLFI